MRKSVAPRWKKASTPRCEKAAHQNEKIKKYCTQMMKLQHKNEEKKKQISVIVTYLN